MGRSRQSIDAIFRTVSTMRTLQATRLNREYAPVQRRLTEIYNGKLAIIQDSLANLNDIDNVIKREFADISQAVLLESPALQASGVRAGYDLAVAILNKGGVNVRFSPAQLTALLNTVDYATSEAFQEAVGGYGAYHAQVVGQMIIAGQAQGLTSAAIQAQVWQYFAGAGLKPLIDIENLTRTLLNYSARRATSEVYKANGITQWIWIANIGNPRTCLSCIMQHGTIHDIDKEPFLNDHHRGRCAQAPVTPLWSDLAKSTDYQTGQQYFDALNDQQKRLLLGAKLFEAYQSGQAVISPQTVTGTYTNSIFGEMTRRNSNAEIIRLSQ